MAGAAAAVNPTGALTALSQSYSGLYQGYKINEKALVVAKAENLVNSARVQRLNQVFL